uniref:Uncharacterized protein n=1 Tax=Plectus sambesii TaxID=2011161 RepID=A0A914V3T4_9BILA
MTARVFMQSSVGRPNELLHSVCASSVDGSDVTFDSATTFITGARQGCGRGRVCNDVRRSRAPPLPLTRENEDEAGELEAAADGSSSTSGGETTAMGAYINNTAHFPD